MSDANPWKRLNNGRVRKLQTLVTVRIKYLKLIIIFIIWLKFRAQAGFYRAEGVIKNVNTLEEFKSLDKAAIQDRAARTVCTPRDLFLYSVDVHMRETYNEIRYGTLSMTRVFTPALPC